ncbi:MAG: VWA domain-containing protein [Candidatus Aminicenantales bacterium]
MKKFIWIIVILVLAFLLFSQQEEHEVVVRNVEVPVRVFDGNRFVDNLTIDDFEVYENGILQKIEALYLTDKSRIAREEGEKQFSQLTSRHYYFLFQIIDYNNRFDDAIDHFFQNIIQPGDTLTIWTPQKPYSLSSEAIKQRPKEALAKEMKKLLRKDTKAGSSAYRSVMRNLQRLVNSISGQAGSVMRPDMQPETDSQMSSLGMLLQRYRSALEKLEELRIVDQKVFLQFAAQLKRVPGQKYVYFFYEREFRPELSPNVINNLVTAYQDQPNILGELQDLFQFYHRYERVDKERIKQAFADASVCFNFMFLSREAKSVYGVYMREQSEDFFPAFREAALATGGVVDNSQNPAIGFKNALEAAEHVYLLYYTPANYKPDGSYKSIEVRVKNKDYKLSYRHGYYAR